jgi:hypothetical protein
VPVPFNIEHRGSIRAELSYEPACEGGRDKSGRGEPLEVMLDAMRSHYEAGDLDKAAAFAKDAAPYVHPRIANIEVSGNPDAPIEIRDMTNAELARRIAFILGQAAREKAANGGDDPEPLLQAQLPRSGDS